MLRDTRITKVPDALDLIQHRWSTMSRDDLSQDEARRLALAAQGFDRPRPGGPVNATHLRRTIRQLGLIQLDFVNVVVPAHYQVPYSRLGPYERSRLDEIVYTRREFTEQWAHEASIVPMETWPLLRHRMETRRVRPYGFEKFLERNPEYVERVLGEVRTRGPLTADEVPLPDDDTHFLPSDWYWSVRRAVLEVHFGRGVLAVTERRPGFARVYDLAERVIAAEYHVRQVDRDESQRELLRPGRSRARRRHAGRPGRLLPHVGAGGEAPRRRAGRDGRTALGVRRGMACSCVSPSGSKIASPH